ncbi:hypothetical protein EWM64_g10522 [Hericium alpestre]|uniref:Uncharacterized protein n=1 Tax=Hericium alpestre TaxID=135208 RepID=A0A4Y9ZI55_9AGAM|nr:hypothetical protein EWM64_g10522 [Hericium alpestre]
MTPWGPQASPSLSSMDRLINLPVIQSPVDFGPLLDRALDVAEEEEDASLLDDASLACAVDALSVGGDGAPLPQNTDGGSPVLHPSPAMSLPVETDEDQPSQSEGNREGKRMRRRNKRRAEREKRSPWNYQPKLRVGEKHSTPDVIDVSFGVEDFPATRNAYVAKAQAIIRERPLTVQDLKDIGMPIKEWEGKTSHVLRDRGKFNVGYLLGQPNDEDWPAVVAEANRVFEEARVEGEGHFTASEKKTRRGEFVALVAGVTFCKSKEHPDVRGNLEKQQELIDRLCENPAVARIAGFGSASMAYGAPKIYRHYVDHLEPLYERYGLSTLFGDSIFPSANFNLGPQSASAVHADSGNVPYGHCHITALGNFDHKKGGHFVFWDLGFAVEFPPGASILIPSACVRHGNTVIQDGEKRYSFTQYCPGSLIQWVRCGFRTAKSLTQAERDEIDGVGDARRQKLMNLFSKYDELAADQQLVFKKGKI